MTKTRRIVAKMIGLAQCGIGGVSMAFTYLVYASESIRDSLAITAREVSLSMLVLSIFGLMSIASGMLLVREDSGRC